MTVELERVHFVDIWYKYFLEILLNGSNAKRHVMNQTVVENMHFDGDGSFDMCISHLQGDASVPVSSHEGSGRGFDHAGRVRV